VQFPISEQIINNNMDIDDNLNNADEKEEVAEIDIVIFNVKLTI